LVLGDLGHVGFPKITEEEVTIAEAFARGVRVAAERQRLEGLAT